MEAVKARVDRECVRLLSRQSVTTLTITLGVAPGLLYILWPEVPHFNIIIWAAAFFSVSIARFIMIFIYFRNEEQFPTHVWRRILDTGIFLTGVTWGLSALWLFSASLIYQMALVCLMMALASAATSSLAASLRAFIFFLLPTTIPICLRALLEPTPIMHFGAVIGLFYSLGMILLARNNNRMIERAFELRFENEDLASELGAMIRRDPLTGLANRLTLIERFDLALKRAKRGVFDVAVMFIDCDGFKSINDSFGHGFGDEYLKCMARTLTSCVRDVDTVARLGGDEFIILLEQAGEKGQIARVAERIFEKLTDGFQIGSELLRPKLSLGISCYPHDGTSADALIHQADEAMYRIKHHGGNGFEFF